MYGSSSIASAPVGSISRKLQIALLQAIEVDIEGNDLQPLTYLVISGGEVDVEGDDIQPLTFLKLTSGEVDVEGDDTLLVASGTVLVSLESGEVIVEGEDADVTYLIEDVPELLVNIVSGTEVSIDVENQDGREIRIYRADSEQGLFSPIVVTDTLPYSDTGLTATQNYKYIATFASEGIKGGSSFIAEGQKSDPRYRNRTS